MNIGRCIQENFDKDGRPRPVGCSENIIRYFTTACWFLCFRCYSRILQLGNFQRSMSRWRGSAHDQGSLWKDEIWEMHSQDIWWIRQYWENGMLRRYSKVFLQFVLETLSSDFCCTAYMHQSAGRFHHYRVSSMGSFTRSTSPLCLQVTTGNSATGKPLLHSVLQVRWYSWREPAMGGWSMAGVYTKPLTDKGMRKKMGCYQDITRYFIEWLLNLCRFQKGILQLGDLPGPVYRRGGRGDGISILW